MKTFLPAFILLASHFAAASELPYYTEATFTPQWIEADNAQGNLHAIPAFAFQNQRAETLTQDDLAGKIYVANFFFTTCPGICAKMTRNLTVVHAAFADDPSVMLLSHSVTPAYDTPERLKAYAAKYDVLGSNWQFVTGDKDAIYTIARQFYFADDEIGLSQDSNTFLHSEKLILVDGHGHIRGVYNGVMTIDMQRLIQDIRTLLACQ